MTKQEILESLSSNLELLQIIYDDAIIEDDFNIAQLAQNAYISVNFLHNALNN